MSTQIVNVRDKKLILKISTRQHYICIMPPGVDTVNYYLLDSVDVIGV